MSLINIVPIPAFKDNYIWLLYDEQQRDAVVIDPGEAIGVITVIKKLQLKLKTILITHHHHDHVGGLVTLSQQFKKSFQVYVPKLEAHLIPKVDVKVAESDCVDLGFGEVKVIEVPGHTKQHLAYYGMEKLFCGDTVFVGGCGRVFEGTMAQMYASLQKIKSLPTETEIYCAHEYTESNLRFAVKVEPENELLQQRLKEVIAMRKKNLITVPTLLSMELAINPFLRVEEKSLQLKANQIAGKTLGSPAETFATIRRYKDQQV